MAHVGEKLSFKLQRFHRFVAFLGKRGIGRLEMVEFVTRGEDRIDASAKFHAVERLGHVIARAQFQPTHDLRRRATTTQDDDGNLAGARRRLEFREQLKTVQPWQSEIEQYQISGVLAEIAECFGGVVSMGERRVGGSEEFSQHLGHRRIVLDQ